MQCAGRWRRKAPLPSRPLSALTAGRLVSGSFSLASRPATTLSSRSTSSAMLARAVRYSMHNCCYKCRSMLSRLRRKGALVALRAQPAQQRLFVLHWGGSRIPSLAALLASIIWCAGALQACRPLGLPPLSLCSQCVVPLPSASAAQLPDLRLLPCSGCPAAQQQPNPPTGSGAAPPPALPAACSRAWPAPWAARCVLLVHWH